MFELQYLIRGHCSLFKVLFKTRTKLIHDPKNADLDNLDMRENI